MPADRFKPDTQRFDCRGLNVNSAVDAAPANQVPALAERAQLLAREHRAAPGADRRGTSATTPWHSVRRLNDNLDWGMWQAWAPTCCGDAN